MPSEYEQRAHDQGVAWIRGESQHNKVDDECCPDFSCCMPALFEPDRLKRVAEHNRYCKDHGFQPYTDS